MKNIYQANCHLINTETTIVMYCLPDSGGSETLEAVDQAGLELIGTLKACPSLYSTSFSLLSLFFILLFIYLFILRQSHSNLCSLF